jgi:ABC-2 type transport system permease protein
MLSTVVLLGNGMSVAPLWRQLPFFQMSLMLLFHLVLGHGLYYAPFYGWLLLVSGWARRATFLWAALPLFAIGIVERIAFNTTHFATMLASRFTGGAKGGDFPLTVSESMHPLSHLIPLSFLISPGLWIGLAVFAAFLAAAVRIRRYQGPI